MSKAAVSKDVSRYFEVIPDLAAFMDADGLARISLTISQLAKAARTTVHTVQELRLGKFGTLPRAFRRWFRFLYDQCALKTGCASFAQRDAAALLILRYKTLALRHQRRRPASL
ncbi:hypothetical protein P4S73_02900 [Paraglaciecola sp. Hal342]